MPELSFDTLPLVMALVVPGFVWARVHGMLQISVGERDDSWLGHFTLSALNFAAWSWLVPRLWLEATAAARSGQLPSAWFYAQWFIVAFGSPVVLGVATGYVARNDWIRRGLNKVLRVSLRHPVPTAWEYVFGLRAQTAPLWAAVTLLDGSVVEGLFSDSSFASSKPGERDIYIEIQAKPDAAGDLLLQPRSAGVWVSAGQIKGIEFSWVRVMENNS